MNQRSYLFRGLLVTLVFAGVAFASYQLGVHRKSQAASAQQAKSVASLVADVEYHTSEALAKDDLRSAFMWTKLLQDRAPKEFSRLRFSCRESLLDQFNLAMQNQDYTSLGALLVVGREVELESHIVDEMKKRVRYLRSQMEQENEKSPFCLLSNT